MTFSRDVTPADYPAIDVVFTNSRLPDDVTAQLPAFVEAVDPKIVLVSSRGTRHADPQRAEFFDRLVRTRRCYWTAYSGWICAQPADNGQWNVRTQRP